MSNIDIRAKSFTKYHASSAADNFEIVDKNPKLTILDKGNEKPPYNTHHILFLWKF